MSNNTNQNATWTLIVFGVLGIGLLMQMLSGGSSSTTTPSYSPPSSSGDAGARRYVEQRFRQEGYSSQDSATAADAILKFQRAQDARRNR